MSVEAKTSELPKMGKLTPAEEDMLLTSILQVAEKGDVSDPELFDSLMTAHNLTIDETAILYLEVRAARAGLRLEDLL